MTLSLGEIQDTMRCAEETLARFPYDRANIAQYREMLAAQLAAIDTAAGGQDADPQTLLPMLKLGTTIAARIVKTRICEVHGDDYLLTAPDIIDEDLRRAYVAVYDRLKELIRAQDRLFIADLIERSAPDGARRIRLLQDHDEKIFHIKISRQASNSSINKLFGSSIRQ